ncbi:sodium ABC transporter ATP-binding protein [Sporosarcina sp. P12(2017)]|uniref:ABC transporter ATP-binding protein n=1 Tax=unclassified Sporosarcina TaxID=2647733 RepID=UPI000C165690|nr:MULTISPECIES: ABC transporter ATP-binding protein [unclassified Sporosarcina]PIC56521.1 sodium ABC transporter ATP-binding protein [Sporosarcina sp. P10]PIC60172.1 sodium ABC transporter ATP-binding protein [Sporosarcina sp. P12(2017)]PIC75661.1 sodium ABC transporter ATP-binding protein [Sporosarcina sp. P19]
MALELERVTKRFGDFTAVDQLSLMVEEGTMYGFLGANGAGKTTTFRMILGLLTPTEGNISWNGRTISYETSPLIGYLPEERGLYPKMKVLDQLIFLGQLRGMKKSAAKSAALHWLDRFEVPQNTNKKVEELSKGNQQKIQVIAALLHDPQLLILDEPFSGLDPVNVEMLKKAIVDFRNSGATILFSSHRMDHVEELCEQLSIIHHGKQLVSGKLRDVKRSFGKQNVRIRADFPLLELESIEGVTTAHHSLEGAVFQVEDEQVAHTLLQATLQKGPIRQFEIEEPSLQDIFIAKVGEGHA